MLAESRLLCSRILLAVGYKTQSHKEIG